MAKVHHRAVGVTFGGCEVRAITVCSPAIPRDETLHYGAIWDGIGWYGSVICVLLG